MYGPHEAVKAAVLEPVVSPDELRSAGVDAAMTLAELDPAAHAATKLRARGRALAALREAIESELVQP